MSTSQKVVVVTGASQGICAVAVKAFRKLGHRIVATARTIKPSDDPNILKVAGDIVDPETARRVVTEGVARFGRIDTLVNNAGIFVAKPFTKYTAGDYAAVTSVNLADFIYITWLAIAEMEKNLSGHVINFTTSLVDHAINGVPLVLASPAKGGLNALRNRSRTNTQSRAFARTQSRWASLSCRSTLRKPTKHLGHCTRSVNIFYWPRCVVPTL
jgi:NAD(P)-dependent dehydrogenase (short-subunit alcohol dehydrogenase family)